MVDISHLTKEQETYERAMKHRPHVVILGAGATIAAIPNGDKYGKHSSCMAGFIENLDLSEIVQCLELQTESNNLEDIYSEIYEKTGIKKYDDAKRKIEESIFNYFSNMELPDSPTIYDYLLLSLREKDIIASFNWDPLLIQAGFRLLKLMPSIKLPLIVFLHGNVSLCVEKKTNKIRYWPTRNVDETILLRTPLLFPIKNKNYDENKTISDAWSILKSSLKIAYMVTIFGYSAPKSDVAAISLMKEAWGNVEKRNLEEIEVIDIKSKEETYDLWKDFIHTHHFSYSQDFYKSTLGRYPRRTIEALFDGTMNCYWQNNDRGIKPNTPLENVISRFKPLFLDEALKNDGKDEILDNPYINSFI